MIIRQTPNSQKKFQKLGQNFAKRFLSIIFEIKNMKIETTFLGERFYFGSFKGSEGAKINLEMHLLREEITKKAIEEFRQRMAVIIPTPEVPIEPRTHPADTPVVTPERPVVPEHPVATEVAPVVTPEATERTRRRPEASGQRADRLDIEALRIAHRLMMSTTPKGTYQPIRNYPPTSYIG